MRMVNVGIGLPRTWLARATTMLESTPPLRYDTTGTSARSRRSTAAQQHLLELVDQRLRVAAGVFLAAVGEIDLPVGVFADAGRLAVAAELDRQVMAGRQRWTPWKQVTGPGRAKKVNR